MNFLHLSDLHLGKWLGGFSLLEDQRHILRQILDLVARRRPDAVLLAGDIYDKPIPSAEAVQLFDDFLYALWRQGTEVFIISGNHDSPERLAFGARLMDRSGIHVSQVYDGTMTPITLCDDFGDLRFYLLPFVKPAHVRRFYPEESVETYTEAVSAAIAHMDVDPAARNVLLAHQFVTGAVRAESEELTVGGLDSVDAAVFAPFDYVALGHLHRAQKVGDGRIRYCGAPLKYAFSETEGEKSAAWVSLMAKGDVQVETVPLTPLRDMRRIRGRFADVTARDFPQRGDTADYLQVTLTDEEDVPEALGRLRSIYPHLTALDYDNTRTRTAAHLEGLGSLVRRSPLELLETFYAHQNGHPMGAEQAAFAEELLRRIWEEET